MNNRSAAADHVRSYCLSVNTPSDSRVEADVGAGVPPRSSERSAGVLLPWVISEDVCTPEERTDVLLVITHMKGCDRGQLTHRFPLIDMSVAGTEAG